MTKRDFFLFECCGLFRLFNNLEIFSFDLTFIKVKLTCKANMATTDKRNAPRSIRDVVKFASISNTLTKPKGITDRIVDVCVTIMVTKWRSKYFQVLIGCN